MIDGVGKTGPGRLEVGRVTVEGTAPLAKAGSTLSDKGTPVGGAVSELVAGGPPVNGARVAAIRAAIAEGRYPVDPEKIAERMIALDLPQRG
jgi:negative regulator of flagellin synthesis FlgM